METKEEQINFVTELQPENVFSDKIKAKTNIEENVPLLLTEVKEKNKHDKTSDSEDSKPLNNSIKQEIDGTDYKNTEVGIHSVKKEANISNNFNDTFEESLQFSKKQSVTESSPCPVCSKRVSANCRGFRNTPIRHCLNNVNKGVVFQLLTSLVATLMAFSDGMSMGWTSPMIPYFIGEDSYFKMTQHEAEGLETWFLVGAVVGVPFTGYLVNKIGRKKSLLLSSCLLIVAWIIIALVKHLEVIYFARALSGFGGNMAFVAAPCYVSEIAEQKIRGFLSSIIFLVLLVGVLTVYAVSPPHVPYYVSPVIGICLLMVELIVFSLLPESPYYLLYNDQKEAAKKSLKFFRSSGLWEQELNDITAAIERQKNSKKGGLIDIWKVKSYRKSFLIMTLLNMAQQFSAIDVILMNMHQMLEEAGSIYLQPTTTATLFAVSMLIAGAIASATVDKFGRKKLMYISSILTGLCLLSIAIYFQIKNSGYEYESFSWLPLVSIMVYAFVFKYGMGMVPVVVTGEIFAAKIKEMGVALVDGVYVAGTILAIQVYLFLKNQFGMQVPFYIFSCCSFVTCIFVKFYMPETKGRTLDEIQLMLEGK